MLIKVASEKAEEDDHSTIGNDSSNRKILLSKESRPKVNRPSTTTTPVVGPSPRFMNVPSLQKHFEHLQSHVQENYDKWSILINESN